MTIETFKKTGNKFKNGIAYRADGRKYVGKLTHQTKNGETLVMEYDDYGELIATRYKDGNLLSSKRYSYTDNKLYCVTDATLPETDKNRYISFISENGNQKSISTKKYKILINYKKGTIYMDSLENNNTKYYYNKKLEVEAIGGKYTIYHKDGKTPRIVLGDNIEVYDNTGKETLNISRLDDRSKQYYDLFKEIMAKYHLF